MALTPEKVSKIEETIVTMKEQLNKYRELYLQDGTIDAEEQAFLDNILDKIGIAEDKIKALNLSQENVEGNDMRKEMTDGLFKLKSELESMVMLLGIE
jgi:ribosome assembly protein YihI (activator of Der GTPase)